MNPPLKRGKYTISAANLDLNDEIGLEEQSGSSSSSGMKPREKEGWKHCDYVSNRTRLRCQNMRRTGQLKEYGFCEEHLGYIARIRKEGLRSKHIFDPSFEISQNYMQLISCDDDETLEPRSPTEFPFVYESMYCDCRFDDDQNPLRPARIYSQKEISEEYSKSMKRLNSSLREQRIIYKEKHIRLLQQIARINGQTDKFLLDPIKEAEKIAHLLLMRKEALKQNREIAARNKFARMDEKTVENCWQRRVKWPRKQTEMGEEGQEEEEEEGIGVRMVLDGIDKINNAEKEKDIEEGGGRNIQNNKIMVVEDGNGKRGEANDVVDASMVCARINRPFNGKRRNGNAISSSSSSSIPTQLDQQPPTSTPPPAQQVNNKIINHQNNIKNNNNNNILLRNVVDHDYGPSPNSGSNNWPPAEKSRMPTPLQQIKKTSMPIIGCIGGGTTNSYQQYLQQRHIQVKQQMSIGRHHQVTLSRNQIYGNNGHHPPLNQQSTPQMANNTNNSSRSTTTINAKKTRIEHLK